MHGIEQELTVGLEQGLVTTEVSRRGVAVGDSGNGG
jgi:hypothetical protein